MNRAGVGSTPSSVQRLQAIPALTSLRFLAAIYVVLFHLSPATTYPFPLNRLIDQGRAGVAFFFVLSGFILMYNYAGWFRTGTSQALRFYQARLARIYPMHVVGLLLCTPLTLYFLHTSGLFASRWFGGNILPGDVAVSWLVNLVALQAFIPIQAFQYFWNSPGWSISAEFFFYALFPLLARLILRHLRSPRALLLFLACVLFVQVSVWASLALWIAGNFQDQAYHDAMDLLVYKPPFMRLPEFLVGCVLGALYLQAQDDPAGHPLRHLLRSSSWRNLAILIGLAGCVGIVFLPTPGPLVLVLLPMKFFVLFTPVFGLLILTLASGRTVLHYILEHPWAVLLGEASFSVYILHGSVRMAMVDAAQYAGSIPLWGIVLIVAAIVLASIGTYQFIEIPVRRALRPRSGHRADERRHQLEPDGVLNPISTVAT